MGGLFVALHNKDFKAPPHSHLLRQGTALTPISQTESGV